ncbi:CG11077, partial [Drosophila busckii]
AMALSAYFRESIKVGLIMGGGDMIAQFGIEKKSFNEWNYARTARFGALGLVVVGPALRKWYMTLDGMVAKKQPTLQRGFKKMFIDQTLFAPPFTLALSFIIPYMNGDETDKIISRIKEDYFTIMKGGYMLWPLAQIVNFTLVPLQYQVLYVQIIALAWNSFLSMMLNK